MKLIDVHAKLVALNQSVFTTRDVAACLNTTGSHASLMLRRLSKSGHIVALMRGLWAFPDKVDTLALPSLLTTPFPSYVSLQSALYYHGMVSQIPSITYSVSIARTKLYRTALGDVSVHHVDPSFFFGFERSDTEPIWMAIPEKALLDVLYLSSTKSRLFTTLPELEIPKSFSVNRLQKMIKKITSRQRRTLVYNRLNELSSSHKLLEK